MKRKIIGLFVCLLIISSLVIPVTAITKRHDIRTTSYDADVPIWKKGYRWTYHFTESRTHGFTTYLFGDLNLKVVEDSGDSYILEASTIPDGEYDLGGFGIKTTILTSFTFKLKMRKADLGLESFEEKLKGIFRLKIGSLTLPIPIQGEIRTYVEFDPTWAIIPFPLFDGKSGTLNGTEIWHINVYAHLFWGLVSAFGPQNISIPLTPIPYTCSEEQIIVQGDTYNVFNVSAEWMDGSRFESYYAEDVGNVAKEIIYIPYGGGYVWHSLILELKDYSFNAKTECSSI